MSSIDWIVLALTLLLVVIYGAWKSRGMHSIDSFILADKKLPWYNVGLSVMATQASAITFLSLPGQAYNDGLRFVQFYFGLPIAMVVLCITFIPAFKNLNVYTAYEYLEKRFDKKTRSLTAMLFLLQRGLSTGISIYAPAIVLSAILNISIIYTTLFTGCVVIAYTVYGGTKATSYTQLLQMLVIFSALFIAVVVVIRLLPANIGLFDALHIAGKMEKMNAVNTGFSWNDRYNIWSGIIGGFFLQLSYFGTDQSQVGRYLTGRSVKQSRIGLILNGIIKIPMQFLILLTGVLVFTYYQFQQPPLFFNRTVTQTIEQSEYKDEFQKIETDFASVHQDKTEAVNKLATALKNNNHTEVEKQTQEVQKLNQLAEEKRKEVTALIKSNKLASDANDTNYIFMEFVMSSFPKGIIGLIVAIIFLSSMGSIASGFNSLASTTVVDFYKPYVSSSNSKMEYLKLSRLATLAWGVFCVIVGLYAGKLGNLIEVVNILGSLFYGTILGIFCVAFYLKRINGTAVFYAALITEAFVIYAWLVDLMAFLWLNVLGCIMVMIFALLIQQLKFSFIKEKQ